MHAILRRITARRHHREGEEPVHLIVGLGNPGPRYRHNRHNVGFQCVDRLAAGHGLAIDRKRFRALYGEGTIGSQRVVLAKPQTYMNRSGRAVAALARWLRVPPERVLVVHDDLDLPLGRLRLRRGGSAGGHRGVASIIADLHSDAFARLRIGIDRPPDSEDPIDYVLANISADQEETISAALDLAAEAIVCYLEEGLEAAMNAYNGRV